MSITCLAHWHIMIWGVLSFFSVNSQKTLMVSWSLCIDWYSNLWWIFAMRTVCHVLVSSLARGLKDSAVWDYIKFTLRTWPHVANDYRISNYNRYPTSCIFHAVCKVGNLHTDSTNKSSSTYCVSEGIALFLHCASLSINIGAGFEYFSLISAGSSSIYWDLEEI